MTLLKTASAWTATSIPSSTTRSPLPYDGRHRQCDGGHDILDPYFERSGYNAVEVSGPTDEWLLTVEDNIVVSCSVGGNSGWQLYSVSRWTSSDALRLKKDLELEFEEKSNRDIYWDDIPVFIHKDEFCLGIRKMDAADIVEIDSFSELVNTDKSYQEYGITVQPEEC